MIPGRSQPLKWTGCRTRRSFRREGFNCLKISRQFVSAVVDRDAPPAEFTQEIGLGKPGRLRRLPQRGFLGHKQADGQMQRGLLRREARIQGRWQRQFHGGKLPVLPVNCKRSPAILSLPSHGPG